MESRLLNARAASISKRSRSVGLVQSGVSGQGHGKGRSGVGDGDVEKTKKRKSRSDVGFNSTEPKEKKSRNSLTITSGSVKSDGPVLDLGRNLNRAGGLSGFSLSLDGSGNAIQIPRRPRGFVGIKSRVPNPSGSSSSVDQTAKLNSERKDCTEALPGISHHAKKRREQLIDDKGNLVDQTAKLNSDLKDLMTGIPSVPQHAKKRREQFTIDEGHLVDQTAKFNSDLKDRTTDIPIVPQHAKKSFIIDKGNLVDQTAKLNSDSKDYTTAIPSLSQHAKKGRIIDKGNGGDASSREGQSHGKKRKGLPLDSLQFAEKCFPAVDDVESISEDSLDDEENLEKNAAMMLSSRFDPRCTGPSSKSKSSLSHSGGDSGSQVENLQTSSECPSPDNASRMLRPKYNENGYSRKRRHFYAIEYKDKDARWFLNKRIKVFWPLDERWYHGLVNDYDEERKLHHVNYDDRDKEWISLQNELFMLLLLRNEVTDVEKPLQSGIDDKLIDTATDLTTSEADTYFGSHTDSEPIISWMSCSSGRAKSSSGLKRQKTFHLSPNVLPPSSRKITNAHRNSNIGLLEKETSKVCLPDSADRLADEAKCGESILEHRTSSSENGLPIVYFRRRFHKKKDVSFCKPVDNIGQRSLPTCLMAVADRFLTSEVNVLSDSVDPDKLMWSIGSDGMLKLNLALIPFKEFATQLSLPVRPFLDFPFGSRTFRFFRLSSLLQCGAIVTTTWPKVYFELMFVDNEVGLRFFLLEGCLKQAVDFIFLVLTVFSNANKPGGSVDLQIPVTSIRFKLSCIQDLRKQHFFSFFSFSKLKHSNWLYLDSIFQKHCLFAKKLPLPECTLENIQALESRSKKIHINSVSWESTFQGIRRKSFQDIIPIGLPALSKSVKEIMRRSPNYNVMHGMLPFSISFSAAPVFFRNLHLKLLMENSKACVRLRESTLACSLEHRGNSCNLRTEDWAVSKHCSEIFPQVVPESTPGISLLDQRCFGCFTCTKAQLETHHSSVIMNCGRIVSSLQYEDKNLDVARTCTCSKDAGSTDNDVIGHSQNSKFNNLEPERLLTWTNLSSSKDQASPVISGDNDYHNSSSIIVEIPEIDLAKSNVDGTSPGVQRTSDFISTISDVIVFSPNTGSPKGVWTRNTGNLSSSPHRETSPVSRGGRTNVFQSSFGKGPRKPRTQVHYATPFGGSEFNLLHKPPNHNVRPFRRIRRASETRTSDDRKGLACDSNVLITHGDRCWREYGARVALELADNSEWRLAVKFSESTRYSHKVRHVFLPGSTNRYTHAMMWKGGQDWVLEFPDRSQWMLFKEMHEECYNRNIRAASVKNIPIPGVHLVEECEANTEKHPFNRSSPWYFQQIETDVDMAMNPSKILYDMDSEDEEWISRKENSSQTQESCCITDDLFEKIMDMLEKSSYAQQRDHFTVAEIEKLTVGIVPREVIYSIYHHWQQKRKRTGMPLIRHLQPPSWERYQQKMQEWNQLMTKANTTSTYGGKVKAPPVEKPTMFAFCLKPRGLEVPNKGSKHRSQKKFHVAGHSHAVVGDQDGVHTFGRRLNSFAFRYEKATYPDNSPENSDTSPSTRIYSPIDACGPEYFSLNNDASDFDNHPKLYKNKSKKLRASMPHSNLHALPSYNQRTLGKRNGVQRQDMGLPDWPNQKHHQSKEYSSHLLMQLGVRNLAEFRVRDAANAAKHASNIARFKRDKAQRLLSRADHAIHVAVSALMTADAVKASYCSTD